MDVPYGPTARQPFSFYQIQETQPGRGYRLKDILRGTVCNGIEKKASETARRGDILFARVAQIDSTGEARIVSNILIQQPIISLLMLWTSWHPNIVN